MDFWSRVGRRFAWVGLPEALKTAAEEVGVHRSTGWRWAQRLDFEQTPRPPWVDSAAWNLLQVCLSEFRKGHAPRMQLGELASWSDTLPGSRTRLLDPDRALLGAMVDARLVAAILAGERIPCWVDRLPNVMGANASTYRRAARPSPWGDLRNGLADALDRLEMEWGLVSPWSPEGRSWLAHGRSLGVQDALLAHAVRELKQDVWYLLDEEADILILEIIHEPRQFFEHVVDQPSVWYPPFTQRAEHSFYRWLAQARVVQGFDHRWFGSWIKRRVLRPTERVLEQDLGRGELGDQILITFGEDSARVTAKAMDGSTATIELPRRHLTFVWNGTAVVYPAQTKHGGPDVWILPRAGGGFLELRCENALREEGQNQFPV
jgi:hypothetical protein